MLGNIQERKAAVNICYNICHSSLAQSGVSALMCVDICSGAIWVFVKASDSVADKREPSHNGVAKAIASEALVANVALRQVARKREPAENV